MCFEPMTAPTDALAAAATTAEPGQPGVAQFSIRV